MEIHESVIYLLEQPELSYLPTHNRQDIIACITLSMIEVAETANPEIKINQDAVCAAVLKLCDEKGI